MRQDCVRAYLLPLSALESRGTGGSTRNLDDDGYSGAPALGLSPNTFLSHSTCFFRYFCCFPRLVPCSLCLHCVTVENHVTLHHFPLNRFWDLESRSLTVTGLW